MEGETIIHYRRHRGDEAGWELWLWAPDAPGWAPRAAVRPCGRAADAWGAVFRLPRRALAAGPLGVLPRTPDWAAKDAPERVVRAPADAEHVYLLEGRAEAEASPFAFAGGAVALVLPRGHWVVLRDGGVREVEPEAEHGDGVVFVRDGGVGVSVVCDVAVAAREIRGDGGSWFEGGGDVFRVDQGELVEHRAGGPFVEAALAVQAASCAAVDIYEALPIGGGEGFEPAGEGVAHGVARAAAPARGVRALVVLVLGLAADAAPRFVLSAGGLVGLDVGAPATRRLGDAEVQEYAAALPWACRRAGAAFVVEIDEYTPAQLYEGVPLFFGCVVHGALSKPETLVWNPQVHGYAAALVLGVGLVPVAATRFVVHYHRFGEVGDGWELRVRCEGVMLGDAEDGVLRLRPLRNSGATACFDLSVASVLPKDAVLALDCVEVCAAEAAGGDEGEVVKQDVSRVLSLSAVPRTGKGAPDALHMVQGRPGFQAAPPSRRAMEAVRYVNVNYRRWGEADHHGWELWCWDEADVLATNHAVSPSEGGGNGAGLHFVVDRARFGGGASVRTLPRYGGESWLRKDEPARALPAAEVGAGGGEATSVFTAQGMATVVGAAEDARRMLRSCVESEDSFLVLSPVPFEWVVDDAHRGTTWELEPKLEQCKGAVAGRDGGFAVKCAGRAIALADVQRINPVTLRCFVNRQGSTRFGEDYLVENSVVRLRGFGPCQLQWRTAKNMDDYYYEGTLGWEYAPERCVFRCFAPMATSVQVVLFKEAAGGECEKVQMRKIPEGCWKLTVKRDLKGMYYKLLAQGEDKRQFPGVQVMDPYSRCNTSHVGRGLIFGYEETPVAPRPDVKPEHTIVYEVHLRDVTIDPRSGVKNRGKYLGFAETGTCLDTSSCSSEEGAALELCDGRVTTALQHIIDMGVNAVQIMPIQDFDNDESDENAYRWGYMPVHFFSPDGWYASSTTSAARVTEFKRLVDALHKAGLKVIMDVVYNHTAEDGNELNLDARFSFNGLAPRYFYRNCANTPKAHNGESTCMRRDLRTGASCGMCVSNGSGCGNEFRSESPMGRKFIMDSLKYWVNEYKVDGFRFDLLGLIDVETVAQAASELHRIDPNIMVYGEPWCGGLTPIRSTEKGMQRSRGFGVFNNSFRDALRGSPFGIEETFIMDGGRVDEVKRGIIGSIDEFTDSALETINYVECHDNYTLWDHMEFYVGLRTDDIKFTHADLLRMHKFAAAILFVSQGVPLIQTGQEMCRTKFGDENSYESPDSVNMIRWETKLQKLNVVTYYQGLIRLRLSYPELFSKVHPQEIRATVTFFEDLQLEVATQCIAFRILSRSDSEEQMGWSQVLVMLNAKPADVVFPLPMGASLQHWVQIVDSEQAGTEPLGRPVVGKVTVSGRSAAVFRRATEEEQTRALVDMRLQAVSDVYETPYDDAISSYVVGVAQSPPESDQAAIHDLVAQRDMFLYGKRTR